jgi:hypothetical protein
VKGATCEACSRPAIEAIVVAVPVILTAADTSEV